jgi:CubicO group peptidase (beta-lactamase class C family)
MKILLLTLLVGVCLGICRVEAGTTELVYPGKNWATKKPDEVGLNARKLKELSDYAGGFGCVVRGGYMVYTWGDESRRKDVASAAKPLYAHFLFKAVEDGKISSLDEQVNKWEPRLNRINKDLRYKDRGIKWRHLANQTSCYGLSEAPGTAFAYNDWQMSLFWDTLFKKVYGVGYETVDAVVLHPELTDHLQCQDNPTFMAFGFEDRPGRLAISPRDFARFGLLYLREGKWKDRQLISREHAMMAVTSPLPNSIPRTAGQEAQMIPKQRSIGSRRIPDNQCDHLGSYSWLWWTNGVGRDSKRHWPDVPVDTYGCFGHGGPRAMVVMPSLDLIISWNDTRIEGSEMENHALRLLAEAVTSNPEIEAGNETKKGVDNVRGQGRNFGDRAAVMWEYLEWSVENVSYSGNPFDVLAKVTFSHTKSGQKRTTEMFYDGNSTWRFRFTGTRTGKWAFKTSSDVPELNSHTGSVTVTENTDPNIRGFLTHIGNKYAIQIKDDTDLQGYLFNVYMSRVEHPAFLDDFGSDLAEVEKIALGCLAEARGNGFEIIFLHVNNNWFKFGTRRHDEHESTGPDPVAFGVLETILKTVHRAGGRSHIWVWGDEWRRWTPRGVPGGINGKVDRRLQRYIAARLGPLPGWTIGYGFDLHEWTNTDALNAWAEYLHEHMGWQHLLCARGYRIDGPDNINSYDGFGRDVPLAATSHGPVDYQEIVEDLDGDFKRPHLYEERHSYKREGFNLDMDGTRRLLWWESMAGGMGGFYGFYPDSPHPYPNPQQLRTHYTFWHTNKRFKLDMQRANNLTRDGYVLRVPSNTHYVFYSENTSSVRMDLTDMVGAQSGIAVDTKTEYDELDIGTLGSKEHVWKAPYRSDWAIAVGSFGKNSSTVKSPEQIGSRRGQIIVDPEHPQWLSREGIGPFFMCGPGDPEDFLYRGKLKPDGTRNGDQMQLIDKMKDTGANCIYLMAVRSHGGDGDKTHNPFVDNDPGKGINPAVLEQWQMWFTEMDKNGIVIYLFFYDDSARIWNTGDRLSREEKEFIHSLVNQFEHHRNLIWCIAEEYQEAFSAKRVRNIAAEIRTADDYNHAIAVHKLNGLDFSEFADDSNIDQFAIQYNVKAAEELHAGVVQAWKNARGRYSLNLSEAADWGSGTESRKKCWACAMGGAYVMILGMDIATTAKSDLEDCGRLVHFFESTNFNEMSPHDELSFGGTKYVLAQPGRSYITYAPELQGKIGLKNIKAGLYKFSWFDCVTGKEITQEEVKVTGGDQSWDKPRGIGNELAVYIRRIGE